MTRPGDRATFDKSTLAVLAFVLVLEAVVVHLVLGRAFDASHRWVKWTALGMHGGAIAWVGLRLIRGK